MTKSSKVPTNSLDYIYKSVLPSLMKHKYSWPFLKAVDYVTLNLPDYTKVIRHSMDLSKIRDKLRTKQYSTLNDCLRDFKIIFSNCYIFNLPGEDVVYMALTLDRILKEKLKCLPSVHDTHFSNSHISVPLHVKNSINGCDNISSLHGKRKLEEAEIRNLSKVQRIESTKVSTDKPILDRNDFDKCTFVIKEIMSTKYQQLNLMFLHPVDVKKLNLFDYFDIVKKPMDFSTIKSKLEANLYNTKEKFVDDVELVFFNCIKYNGMDSELGILAKKFQEIFKNICLKAFSHKKSVDGILKGNHDLQVSTVKLNTPCEKIKQPKRTNETTESTKSTDKKKIFELLNNIERQQDDVLYKFKKVQELVSVQNSEIKELYQKCFGTSMPAGDVENSREGGDEASLMSESILSSSTSTISNSRRNKQSVKPAQGLSNGIVSTPKSVKKTVSKSVKNNSKIKTESAKKPENPINRSKPIINQKYNNETKKKVEEYLPMTYEDKKRLSISINNLSREMLPMVVQIIQANEISLRNCDPEELEIDFETLQSKTLRDLEAFVNNVSSAPVVVTKKERNINHNNNTIKRNKSSSGELMVQSVSGKQLHTVSQSHNSSSSSSSSASNSSSSSSASVSSQSIHGIS